MNAPTHTSRRADDGPTAIVFRTSLVVLGTVLTISLLTGAVAADGHGSYVVEQGGQNHTVGAIADNETASDFYDYRSPYTTPAAYDYSSHGTTAYQQDDASILLLYEGPEGTSLVIVHDRYHATRSDGTTGGSASFDVSGLPSEGEWVVADADYEDQTDVFAHGEPDEENGRMWTVVERTPLA